jgi:hypothetical protein
MNRLDSNNEHQNFIKHFQSILLIHLALKNTFCFLKVHIRSDIVLASMRNISKTNVAETIVNTEVI